MKSKTSLILLGVVIVVLILLRLFVFNDNNNNNSNNNSKEFKEEYDKVSTNNKFVYKNINEVIKTLKSGTGIIYFGFPECPWCQSYSEYLDSVANESNIKEVIYFNILNARKENTKEYQEITKILKEYLNKDDNDNPRVFVPHVVAVKNGKVLGNNNETATITEEVLPVDYWTEDRVANLKVELKKLFDSVTSNICTTDCN